jgi:hypothetical protein
LYMIGPRGASGQCSRKHLSLLVFVNFPLTFMI